MTARSDAAARALASPPQGAATDASEGAGDLAARAARVAAVAAAHADAVDRQARHPAEALAALRRERLLGAMIEPRLGGDGASLGELVDVCHILGRACASTAMIFAMHQIKVACVVRHGGGQAWHEAFMRRLAREQWLVASSTTEGSGGGDVRNSLAPVVREGDRFRLDRDATVMSYGDEADAVVTTARRDAAAPGSDQVLIVLERRDYTLQRTQTWDTLGMRGTGSTGFALTATGVVEQILPEPYALIHARTMTPTAHILWSAVWSGIAAAALERARMFVRRAARGAGGRTPPGATHLAQAATAFRGLRALLSSTLARYEAAADDVADGGYGLGDLELQATLTLLKVDASELAVAVVTHALRTCGLSGYRNEGEASVARHLRDVLSAPLMINNDRILADASAGLLLTPTPSSMR